MRVRIEFRYNAETGTVELFRVDDLGRTVRGQDHDATHEAVAYALGRVLDRTPGVDEVIDADPTTTPRAALAPPEPDPVDERRQERARE